MYILLTDDDTYFVEYLFRELVLSNSITEAMTFKDVEQALKFKKMLFDCCELNCSVNTFIN